MAVESKVIVTAEDRTKAAFAAIQRNTERTTTAFTGMANNALKLAGIGTLMVWFKKNAQATEKWSDEMARLDEVTKSFFNNASKTGQLDPLINTVKFAAVAATGLSTAFGKLLTGLSAIAKAKELAMMGQFRLSGQVLSDWKKSVDEADVSYKKFQLDLFKEAPQGFAKHREEEAERVKNAQAKLKKSEEDRIKAILDHASTAEDAIRAEMEISEGLSGPGLTAMGEGVFNEARAKEDEQAAEKEARERERLTRKLEQIQESFLSEKMLEEAQYEEQKQVLMDRRTEEMFGKEEQYRLLEELELQHQARMGNVSAQGILARRRFQEMNAMQQTQFVLGQMLQLTQGVAANNKAMFQINKYAAISNIALGIPRAMQNALDTYPPPLSFVMAGLQLAASLKNIQQAKSAQFGSATSAPSVGGGGAIPTTNVGGIPDLSRPAAGPQRIINVQLTGSGIFSAEQVRDLIKRINEEQEDGARVTVFAG